MKIFGKYVEDKNLTDRPLKWLDDCVDVSRFIGDRYEECQNVISVRPR